MAPARRWFTALAASLLFAGAALAEPATYQGSWQLDSQASDNVDAQLAAHLEAIQAESYLSTPMPPAEPGMSGGGRRGMGGEDRGGAGGVGRGGTGGRGARDDGSQPTRGMDGEPLDGEGLRALLMGSQLLEMSFVDGQLTVSRGGADPIQLTLGARPERIEDAWGHRSKVQAWWEGEVLVLQRKDRHGTLVEAFLPSDEPDTIYVVVELDSSRMSVPLAFRRVYRQISGEGAVPEDEPTAEEPTPDPQTP